MRGEPLNQGTHVYSLIFRFKSNNSFELRGGVSILGPRIERAIGRPTSVPDRP
jgi:hypothetical protein